MQRTVEFLCEMNKKEQEAYLKGYWDAIWGYVIKK